MIRRSENDHRIILERRRRRATYQVEIAKVAFPTPELANEFIQAFHADANRQRGDEAALRIVMLRDFPSRSKNSRAESMQSQAACGQRLSSKTKVPRPRIRFSLARANNESIEAI